MNFRTQSVWMGIVVIEYYLEKFDDLNRLMKDRHGWDNMEITWRWNVIQLLSTFGCSWAQLVAKGAQVWMLHMSIVFIRCQFWLSDIVVARVCMCVWCVSHINKRACVFVSITSLSARVCACVYLNHELVHAITCHPFKFPLWQKI